MIEPRATALPGQELVYRGIDDLRDGRETLEALLVAIGAPRLRGLGFSLPAQDRIPRRPEFKLYRLLASEDERTSHSRYNALIRRLVSFEHAAEFQRARAARAHARQ